MDGSHIWLDFVYFDALPCNLAKKNREKDTHTYWHSPHSISIGPIISSNHKSREHSDHVIYIFQQLQFIHSFCFLTPHRVTLVMQVWLPIPTHALFFSQCVHWEWAFVCACVAHVFAWNIDSIWCFALCYAFDSYFHWYICSLLFWLILFYFCFCSD